MPPTSSRQLADAVRIHAGQLDTISAWLRPVTGAEYAAPTPLGSVRQVVGHMLMIHDDLTTASDEPTTARPVPLDTVLRAWHRRLAQEHARQYCGSDSGETLAVQFANASVDFAARAQSMPPVVATSCGAARSLDLVRARIVMWLGFAHDLSLAVPRLVGCAISDAALASAVRTLAQLFAARHPGHSVELRIPPYVAVQCGTPGSGASHSRGTPPNVVEWDPIAFFTVTTGRQSWHEAAVAHQIHASGAASDLSAMLPLIEVVRPDGVGE